MRTVDDDGYAQLDLGAVCSRVRELQETISASTIALEISSRNARVQALQERWDYMRAGLDLILNQRGADMADLPGGASGLLCRNYKGKEADRLVHRSRRSLAGRRVARSRGCRPPRNWARCRKPSTVARAMVSR